MGGFFQTVIPPSSREDERPLFITGVPRSGTSWVGELLGSCAGTRYVYEPLNLDWAPALRGEVSHFKYLNRMSEASPILQRVAEDAFSGLQSMKQLVRAAFRGYWGAATGPASRVVVKDPTAPLMAAWIAKQFNARVLVVIRHPCGFSSSLEKLDWQVRVDFLLRQKTLMRNHLDPYADVLRAAMNDKWLNRGAFWAAIHTVLSQQSAGKSDWHFCKYEQLCSDPLGQFHRLIKELSLPMKPDAEDKLHFRSNGGFADPGSTKRNSFLMPGIWKKRMSPAQIDAVMGVVDEFGLNLYSGQSDT